MVALQTVNDIIKRISDGYGGTLSFYGEHQATLAALTGSHIITKRGAYVDGLPAFDTGVTGYLITEAAVQTNLGQGFLLAEMFSFGTFDISGAAGTFTDGGTMPTRTEFNQSTQTYSPIWAEVTTALSAVVFPSVTVTYTDQAGNTGNLTAFTPAAAAVKAAGFVSLAGADWGATDITAVSAAGGTTPAGVIQFWGMLPIAYMSGVVANVGLEELLVGQFNWCDLPASSTLGVIGIGSAAAAGVFGRIRVVGDQ